MSAIPENRDHKVSEFRQEWINGLREDVSALIGLITKIKTSWTYTDTKEVLKGALMFKTT